MIFTAAALPGAFIIEPERLEDERGFFARTWCAQEFAAHGLNPRLAQCSVSFNRRRGTLRGLHYQAAPHEEAKVVQCTRGRLFDVIVDLRPASPAFRRWIGFELSSENRKMIYVPEGCAHGFQTLEDDTEIFYQISVAYVPQSARGVRWNDPSFGIAWPPAEPRIMTERDRTYPDFAV